MKLLMLPGRCFSQWRLFLLVLCLAPGFSIIAVASSKEIIPVLSLPELTGWQTKIFSSETYYELIAMDGSWVLKASSRRSASGLVRKIDVDLNRTPYLNWSWRVDAPLQGNDEASKGGDDYPARIYVVVDGGLLFWRTRAISYVWASTMPKGGSWANAYTGNSMMIAVESGHEHAGQWVNEKRNVLEDLKKLHGINATKINAVAIMTDTDNTGQSTIAYYGNIYFSSH